MKNRIASQLAICLAGAIGLAAQSLPPTAFQAVPELPYRLQPNFFELPNGVNFGEASAVAVNSRGHIFLFQRVKPMLMEYDPSGKFLRSLGEGLFTVPHGLRFDAEDNLWTTDVGSHVVLKLSPEGRVLMVLGRKDDGAEADWLFNRPTDIAFDRNFRFAFWLRTNIPPFASARDLSGAGSKAKDPVVRHTAFAGRRGQFAQDERSSRLSGWGNAEFWSFHLLHGFEHAANRGCLADNSAPAGTRNRLRLTVTSFHSIRRPSSPAPCFL